MACVKIAAVICSALLLAPVSAFAINGLPDTKPEHGHQKNSTNSVPTFSDADAAHLMDGIQQAFQADNQRVFLKLVDSARMPNYPAFRDQISEFFEKYEAFRFRYHMKQASFEDGVGVVLADAELEMTPAGAYVPNLRKSAQLRIVCAWNGKAWKIVDWSPRDFLN
jgi:hypothetical protein